MTGERTRKRGLSALLDGSGYTIPSKGIDHYSPPYGFHDDINKLKSALGYDDDDVGGTSVEQDDAVAAVDLVDLHFALPAAQQMNVDALKHALQERR